MRNHLRAFGLFLILLIAAACSPLVKSEQAAQNDFIQLEPGKRLGQTFTPRYDGLQGVAVFLRPGQPGEGSLTLHLADLPGSRADLRSASLQRSKITSSGYYRFDFDPLSPSNRRDLSFWLDLDGTGTLQVAAGPADTYLNGAAYAAGEPLEAQLAFRLAYSPQPALAGLAGETAAWLLWAAAGLFIFCLPGWALLSSAWQSWASLSWPEKLALASGAGLAIYPLLFLWADLAGVQPGALLAWSAPLVALAILLVSFLRRRRLALPTISNLSSASKGTHSSFVPRLAPSLPGFALLVVLLLLLLARYWSIRSLEGPLWGDSVQHTAITQLILDQGGLFRSWLPYAAYGSLTVQYGFPAAAALFAWLLGLNSLQATLVAGQWISVLAAFSLYPLALRLSDGNRWAGTAAVLIAGLLMPAPAEYTNWGRYAQLAGQAVLPVALWLLWGSLEETGRGALWWKIFLSGLILAGMMLSYYRMPFYYATFVVALLAGWALPRWRGEPRRWVGGLVRLAGIAVVGILLFLPWGVRLIGGNLAGFVEAGATAANPSEAVIADYRAYAQTFEHLPLWLAALALLSTVWAVLRRRWMIAALVLWAALLVSIVGLSLLRVPGANMMQSFAVIIALYLPAGLLVGWLVGEAAALAQHRVGPAAGWAALLIVLAAAGAGAWSQRSLIRPGDYAMLTRPDLRAMAWIRENTPPDAVFLVEGFLNYGGWSAVGSDAGWWLPLLTGRLNTMPPQYALLNEAPLQPGYTQQVVELVATLEKNRPASPQGVSALCAMGVTHVYIGQGQGLVSAGSPQLFDAAMFASNPLFTALYRQDRVSIFSFNRSQCPQNP